MQQYTVSWFVRLSSLDSGMCVIFVLMFFGLKNSISFHFFDERNQVAIQETQNILFSSYHAQIPDSN